MSGLPFVPIISCEHASNAVPADLDLGVSSRVLDSHVAWDPGAKPIAETLARGLNAPLFLGEYTRLVADLNRNCDEAAVVPEIAFDCPVPANQGLSTAQRAERIARYHTPYWTALHNHIESMIAQGQGPVLHLCIHSFTGEFRGELRSMDVGIMLDPARPLERKLGTQLSEFLTGAGVRVAENAPYDGRDTALLHASMRPHYDAAAYIAIQFEVSQNLLNEIDALGDKILAAVSGLTL